MVSMAAAVATSTEITKKRSKARDNIMVVLPHLALRGRADLRTANRASL
jgi:hypothetical protein